MFLDFIEEVRSKIQTLFQLSKDDEVLSMHVEHSNKVKALQECLVKLVEVDKILHEINEHPDDKIDKKEIITWEAPKE